MSQCHFIRKIDGKIQFPILDFEDLMDQIDRDTWKEIGDVKGWRI